MGEVVQRAGRFFLGTSRTNANPISTTPSGSPDPLAWSANLLQTPTRPTKPTQFSAIVVQSPSPQGVLLPPHLGRLRLLSRVAARPRSGPRLHGDGRCQQRQGKASSCSSCPAPDALDATRFPNY